ncbi:hypothetical protein [Thiohalorhabdus sp.]|uniref:hypothetical protein n=1 Tax=Thiohalorhabdus sp. TaxID=3094134 RepID=UPI002FC2D769
MSPDTKSERGVGLIAAVFVIVVLAMLGTALVRIATTEQSAVSREMASAYAFQAGESVAQWGLYQLIARGNSTFGGVQPLTAPVNGLAACGDSRVDSIQLNGLEQFGTVLTPGGSKDLFRFGAVGVCFPGTPEATRRRLEVRFQN